jgi:hypothetical protein
MAGGQRLISWFHPCSNSNVALNTRTCAHGPLMGHPNWAGSDTGELRPAFPVKLRPGRSKGYVVGSGATLGTGGGGCMTTEEGKEACSVLPAAMATVALCFRGFLRAGVRRRAGGSERDEEARKRVWRPYSPPFVPLLPVGSCARCEAGGRRAWHVALARHVRVPGRGVRRGGGRRQDGAPAVHSDDRLKESICHSATQAGKPAGHAHRARRRRCRRPFFLHLALFNSKKLKNIEYRLKFSKIKVVEEL